MTTETPIRNDRYLLHPLVCTTVGLVGNVILTAVKLLVGFMAGSASLVADGFHSFSDLAGDIGVLLALKASSQPPDREHPYGHHNFETLGALGVSLLLLVTGTLLGRNAVTNFLGDSHTRPEKAALFAACGSILIKEAVARYTFLAARHNNSPALRANGAHHRSDALSSIAAALGIAGAMAGRPELDSLAALVISAFIVWMALGLLRDNAMILLETTPGETILGRVEAAARDVEGIRDVTSLRVRPRGSVYHADIAVTVDPTLTVFQGHELSHAVEKAILVSIPDLVDVVIHIEPQIDPASEV